MTEPDISERMLIEQVVANEGPSLGVAYLLLIFFFFLSAHRFYLKRGGSAILQVLLIFVFVGIVWLFIDLFTLPGMVREAREKIRQRETVKLMSSPPRTPAKEVAAPAVTTKFIESLLGDLS